MKFTDALILFCIFAAWFGVVEFFFPASSIQLFEKIWFFGLGVFSCWWQTKPKSQFSGRICRFFKAIPRCWAESKEVSK